MDFSLPDMGQLICQLFYCLSILIMAMLFFLSDFLLKFNDSIELKNYVMFKNFGKILLNTVLRLIYIGYCN